MIPTSVANGTGNLRIVDGTAAIAESAITGVAGGQDEPVILVASVAGDGASHTIKLQYAISGSNTFTIFNAALSTTTTPNNGLTQMIFYMGTAN